MSKLHLWKLITGVNIFLIEIKSLLSNPGKMIAVGYKIEGIAQAETICHIRDLWTFIERSLRIKKTTKDIL